MSTQDSINLRTAAELATLSEQVSALELIQRAHGHKIEGIMENLTALVHEMKLIRIVLWAILAVLSTQIPFIEKLASRLI